MCILAVRPESAEMREEHCHPYSATYAKRPSMAAAVRAAARAASRVGVRSEAACRVASSVELRTRLAASLILFSSRRVR